MVRFGIDVIYPLGCAVVVAEFINQATCSHTVEHFEVAAPVVEVEGEEIVIVVVAGTESPDKSGQALHFIAVLSSFRKTQNRGANGPV